MRRGGGALLLACVTAMLATDALGIFQNVSESNPIFSIEQLQVTDPDFDNNVKFVARGPVPVVMDYNGDGWLDIYLVRYGYTDLLFQNNKLGGFSRIENPFNLDPDNGGNAPVWIDIDNDGDKDFYFATVNKNRHLLYINDGSGNFTEEAVERGVDLLSEELHGGSGVAAGDYNRDGYLDLFVGDWGGASESGEKLQHYALFLNKGESAPGYFENVTEAAGIVLPKEIVSVYAPSITDLDGDAWPDLAIVSDYRRSALFWNNGDGGFTDGTQSAGVGLDTNGMGASIGDANGDGLLDWWVTSIGFEALGASGGTGNQLYLNNGDRTFSSNSEELGIAKTGWAWGSNLFDYDNDGDLDIALTNGQDYIERNGMSHLDLAPMKLWRASQDGDYADVSDFQRVNHVGDGVGMLNFDYDKDGDLDLLVSHQFTDPILLRNNVNTGYRSVRLSFEGTVSNRDGIGAFVSMEEVEGGPVKVSEYNPTNTYMAQLEPFVHFGVGPDLETVYKITIRWPSGIVQELEAVPVEEEIHVVEDESLLVEETIPEFEEPLDRQYLNPGDRLELSVALASGEGAQIQWYHNGKALPGETDATLVIESVGFAHGGKYWATASNSAGTSYSNHARISVRSLYLDKSVARQWNEELLSAIRLDYPAPTVHSRNLFATSAVMWDAWVAYDSTGTAVAFVAEESPPIPETEEEIKAAREEAISYAAYRLLRTRFRLSPNVEITLPALRERMDLLGYDPDKVTTEGSSPAAVGNRIAAKMLAYSWYDGANEKNSYRDQSGYQAVNQPLVFKIPGTELTDPNQWQPLAFDYLVLQNGIIVGESIQNFLGANWGGVRPFALTREDETKIYADPGLPPLLGTETDLEYKQAANLLIEYSSWLDPSDPTMIDVSPAARHNNPLGTNDGEGYSLNPYTGEPYEENLVLRADYGRILAEFWADGPDSETPPGHWNSVANHVTEHPLFEKRFEGEGTEMDALEWDVKLYFALNAAVSDAAIACWDAKRKYNYVRPISIIRYLGGNGQSSDPDLPSYHEEGLLLEDGLVELVTEESSAAGERHEHLAEYVGEISIRSWKGIPDNPSAEYGGVDWIRAVEWMPYQRFTFVTPPFGAYTSGHSTFSRAAAEVLTLITGDPFFPGGISSFSANAHEFLEFESGPEQDIELTWATYYDAADEAGLSRLYGGIHVPADDFGGRIMGSGIGKDAFAKALSYFDGAAETVDWDMVYSGWVAYQAEDAALFRGEDYYADNPIEKLSYFYFGARDADNPVERPKIRIIEPSATGQMQVEVKFGYNLASYEYGLEVSDDLTEWTFLPSEQCLVEEGPSGSGLIRFVFRDEQSYLLKESRFLRLGRRELYE